MRMVYWLITCGIWIGVSISLNLAQAQPKAWLDRDHIAQNERVTLSIESHQPNAEPDYGPLYEDFILGTRSRSQQMQLTSRGPSYLGRFDVELIPRRSGLLTIPPLAVGSHKTIALPLMVEGVNSAHANPSTLGDIFVQTQIDSTRPYVQQNVGIVVRLGHAVPIVSGDLNLPEPANATLQRVGEDQLHKEMINGREYTILERRFILLPERSGPLRLPGAYFKGITGYTRLQGQRQTTASDEQTLDVQPLPDPLPQPWLPLHGLKLRYRLVPHTSLQAGQASTLEIEAIASGAQQGQLTELPTPELEGAGQIFAEPITIEERFKGDSPELILIRRYAVVPQQPGELVIKGIRVPWWDVEKGQLVHTALPTLTLPVQAVDGQNSPNPPAAPSASQSNESSNISVVPITETGFKRWIWPLLAALFALLWITTLLWMLISGRHRTVTVNRSVSSPHSRPVNQQNYPLPHFRQELEQCTTDEVLQMLVAMSGTDNLEAAMARLADPQQIRAIEAVQRVRWRGDGDPAIVRTQLNRALHNGPKWKITSTTGKDELPPLYPTTRTST